MTIIPFPNTQQECSCKEPGWIRLPVAPQATARIRFQGDEKLPQAVSLQGALRRIDELLAQGSSVAGLDIYGPGDPLATQPMTLDILANLREQYPAMPLGLTTLGFGLAGHAGWLSELGIVRINLLVDAVDPRTLQKLYAWIRPGRKNIPLAKGAQLLVEEQARAVTACRDEGIAVSLLTTVYAEINEPEVEKIARRFGGLGAESLTLQPGKGRQGDGAEPPRPSFETMDILAEKAGRHIRTVDVQIRSERGDILPLPGGRVGDLPKPTRERPNVAVLSSNGMDIDLHLGQAIKALIYGPREDGLACLLETRDLPEPGGGDKRWLQAAGIMDDCFALLAASAGRKPRDIMERHGLSILLMEDAVEGTVDVLYGGKKGTR